MHGSTIRSSPGLLRRTLTARGFDALNPVNVKNIITKFGSGKTGTLPDGRFVSARPGSSYGSPTLEIRRPNGRGIEIRYESY